MDITCQSCQGKFKIADGKVPPGKTASVTCPRCKSKISITADNPDNPDNPDDADEDFDDLFAFDEDEGDGYDSADKPFDFMEEEGKSAMVCEPDPLIREKMRPTLDILEYNITEVPNSREALKNMRYYNYDLIVINEYFDTQDPDANPLLIYLERMGMEYRRNIFVAMLTSRFRTMDHMIGFQKSVNMIVNIRNIEDFDKIIQRGMADFGLFYKVFKESLTI